MTEKKINGQEGMLIRDGKHPVYLMADGKFAVEFGGGWKFRTTIAAIDKLCGDKRKAVKIFTAGRYQVNHHCDPEVVEASDMQQSQIKDRDGKRVYKSYSTYFLFDADAVAKLTDLERRRSDFERKINEEREEIVENLTIVGIRNFKVMLELHGS